VDYYAVLGVDHSASPERIRTAFREGAARWHPDRRPGDREAERKFKAVSEAYTILIDPENRSKYDLYRNAPFREEKAPPPSYNYPVADVSLELELDSREASEGCLKTVSVARSRTCPDCRGTGTLRNSMVNVCVLCGGSGCRLCNWEGRVQVDKCSRCWGLGQDKEQTRLVVAVPPLTPMGHRKRFLASGVLWDRLSGTFYVDAYVKSR
jgi:molecular chaperone DnaJ